MNNAAVTWGMQIHLRGSVFISFGYRPRSGNSGTLQFSCSVMSDSLRPHESQHARPPCHHQLPEFTQTHVHEFLDLSQTCSHLKAFAVGLLLSEPSLKIFILFTLSPHSSLESYFYLIIKRIPDPIFKYHYCFAL